MSVKPVRKIRPVSRSISGKYSSQKTQTVHQFESSLERDFLTLLEFDDTIREYGVQPLTIQYQHNDKIARYTPDMLVYYHPDLNRKPLICEIKYVGELQQKWACYAPKFKAATEYAWANGFQFKVFTEQDIRTVYLKNIKFLAGYYQTPIDDGYTGIIVAELSKKRTTTLQDLLIGLTAAENAKILYTAWQMLARRIISCDMQQPITMTSAIWNNCK